MSIFVGYGNTLKTLRQQSQQSASEVFRFFGNTIVNFYFHFPITMVPRTGIEPVT